MSNPVCLYLVLILEAFLICRRFDIAVLVGIGGCNSHQPAFVLLVLVVSTKVAWISVCLRLLGGLVFGIMSPPPDVIQSIPLPFIYFVDRLSGILFFIIFLFHAGCLVCFLWFLLFTTIILF